MPVDISHISGYREMWQEWRFEPWKNGSAEGLYRRVSLIKAGLIGEVARYYVDDYIIWKYEEGDVERIRRDAKPQPELMTQRFVFLQETGDNSFRRSSFWLGFKGFLDIYRYSLGSEPFKDIRDIAYLVNIAEKKVRELA